MPPSNAASASPHLDAASEITAAVDAVLQPAALRGLDRLPLRAHPAPGTRLGNTPMPFASAGAGVEIESHRAYVEGDDLRRLDWGAVARLDQLVVRLFRAEREVPRYFLLDTSASMGFPPGDRKLAQAAALVAGLAYVGVRRHDPVGIISLGPGDRASFRASPVIRDLRRLPILRDFLVALRPDGATALADGVRQWLATRPTPGVAVLVSDFLLPSVELGTPLADLGAHRFVVTCVRVLGPGERDPSTCLRAGALVDAETGREKHVRLDPENLERYRTALQQHLDELHRRCAAQGIADVVLDSTSPLVPSLLHRITAAR